MKNKKIAKSMIVLGLGLLTISAFFVRVANYDAADKRSIDEIVYARMAKQVVSDPLNYNTLAYGKELSKSGRHLPQYFFEPLFKHPPVFTFLNATAMHMFGVSEHTSIYVAALFGALLILVTYFLGKILFSPTVGFLAAFFMWFDPISVICSQKVWMETTLAFFVCSSAVFFLYALKEKRDVLFIMTGVTIGLAINTRYTGILPWVGIMAYALLYERLLFKNKIFLFSLTIPFLFLIPWLTWNLNISGSAFWTEQIQQHERLVMLIPMIFGNINFWLGLIFVSAMYIFFKKIKSNLLKSQCPFLKWACMIFIFGGIFGKHILLSLQPEYVPLTSWMQGTFRHAPPWFYFTQLIEYSLLYIIAFFVLFFPVKNIPKEAHFIRLSVIIYFSFFIVWRNYQSRYILPVLPFLSCLAFYQFDSWMKSSREFSSDTKRVLFTTSLIMGMTFILLKTFILDMNLSFGHDFCYF